MPAYFVANQNYKLGKFTDAINGYYEALKDNPSLIQKEPLVRFKIGYGFYKTGDFKKSLDIFENSRQSLEVIEDYLSYFKFLSELRIADTSAMTSDIKEIRMRFPESPVIPLLDSIQANNFSKKAMSDSAIYYLKRMLKSNYFDDDQIYLELMQFYQGLEDTLQFRNTTFLFLKKYPFHDKSETLYKNLLASYNEKINLTPAKRLFDYLFKTNQFLAAADLLERQTPSQKKRRNGNIISGYLRSYYTGAASIKKFSIGV